METLFLIFACYFILISLLSFILMAVDKRRAVLNKSRISEATLFLFALLGGAASIYFSMGILNHKTQKNKFVFLLEQSHYNKIKYLLLQQTKAIMSI